MLLHPTEMNIQLMKVLQQGSKGCTLCHFCKGIHILGEALAAVTILAVRTWNVGMGIVYITREQYTCMHLAPVGAHLLAVLAAGVEVGNLVGAEHIMHVLCELGLERRHHRELLAHEYLGEQLVRAREDHGLLLEVLDMGALGKELRHVAHLVAGLF